jgi:hypothetical protein
MTWRTERARVAALTRSREPADPDLVTARLNLRVAYEAEKIEKAVAAGSLLPLEQRQRLAAQLLGADG